MPGDALLTAALPGTSAYVVRHLLTWLRHQRPGIVWVEFQSDEIRDCAVQEIDASCRPACFSIERIQVDRASTREDWEELRDRIESSAGLVHVVFSGAIGSRSVASNGILDFALALNLDRERIFSTHSQQVWWVSQDFARQVRPIAPDFLSWIHLRFALTELPQPQPNASLGTPIEQRLEPAAGIHRLAPSHPRNDAPEFAHARELLDRSAELRRTGKLEAALALAGEAVYEFRKTLDRSEAARSGLAEALDTLSNIQRDLGQREQALVSSREAVNLYRELARLNPDVFELDLAVSLNNLSIHQSAMGKREKALKSIEESVSVFRRLAAERPDTFNVYLAGSLNNLASRQSDVGQRDLALANAHQSVQLYRELVRIDRDAFLPDLARALHTLAAMQSNVGQRDLALANAHDAVELYRELARIDRDAFLPDLAASLNNLANRQSNVGQRDLALGTAQEAVELYRELARINRDAFLPDLAGSLNNLANRQSNVGQHDLALGTAQEAVELYRELARTNRDAFLPDLAGLLHNLAIMQSNVGQRDLALGTAQEAVELRRELAQISRDAFLPDLARSLIVLGDCLAASGRTAEALSAAEEALIHLRELFEKYPQALDGLAQATINDYLDRSRKLNKEPDPAILEPYSSLVTR